MRVVRQVFLSEDGVDLDYMADSDVRAAGEVLQTHHVSIAKGGRLDTLVASLEGAIDALLDEALLLWQSTPPVELDLPEQDDEEGEEYQGR